jgi:AcrR family transcriptional regulator
MPKSLPLRLATLVLLLGALAMSAYVLAGLVLTRPSLAFELRAIRPLCTVLATTGLLVGAIAAVRGRTWGILLATAASTAFVGAFVAGIAPLWFVGVAAPGALAAAVSAPRLWRADRVGAATLIAASIAAGVLAALLAGPALPVIAAWIT